MINKAIETKDFQPIESLKEKLTLEFMQENNHKQKNNIKCLNAFIKATINDIKKNSTHPLNQSVTKINGDLYITNGKYIALFKKPELIAENLILDNAKSAYPIKYESVVNLFNQFMDYSTDEEIKVSLKEIKLAKIQGEVSIYEDKFGLWLSTEYMHTIAQFEDMKYHNTQDKNMIKFENDVIVGFLMKRIKKNN
jgi:hypothetical protein